MKPQMPAKGQLYKQVFERIPGQTSSAHACRAGGPRKKLGLLELRKLVEGS